ncbi:hypothetical protein N7462_003819 [Penicillium macrosclerotiorum]|uniref:uncharacterized protein n=1 Tax=Penicillium macrosclerotiorum TaxID=303699 RepID=UPI002546D4F1|nr:uncharacterized protein N7462_003819 [Penicillium macrosclerotiorum]KAJ5689427.1 hypothetical protein N7462_003819 [Penicillium macrosclerotiorum]
MAFPLFSPPTILRLGLGLGIGLSAATLHPLSPFRAAPMQCQYSAPYYRPETQGNSETGWAVNPNDPLLQKQGRTGIGAQARTGFLTRDNMRQISLGSVLGLVAGVGLRAFSKALVVIIGMGVVLVEWAASKGYNILPLDRVQKYVKNVDLRRAVNEHRPFKISFGAMMALAAFAQF